MAVYYIPEAKAGISVSTKEIKLAISLSVFWCVNFVLTPLATKFSTLYIHAVTMLYSATSLWPSLRTQDGTK